MKIQGLWDKRLIRELKLIFRSKNQFLNVHHQGAFKNQMRMTNTALRTSKNPFLHKGDENTGKNSENQLFQNSGN